MFELTFDKLKPSNIDDKEFLQNNVNNKIKSVSRLYWQEHCVECALPDCYSVCSLYSPRVDGNCKRFSFGISPDYRISGSQNFCADIHFKKWAKLEAYWPSNPSMISKNRNYIESRIISLIHNLYKKIFKNFKPAKRFSAKFAERFFKLTINSFFSHPIDGLFVRFYYQETELRKIQIEISSLSSLLYRNIIDVKNGWNERFIPYSELPKNFSELTRISVHPIDSEPIRLVFSHLDLVTFMSNLKEELEFKNNSIKVKCICWDLDNTLWKGIIGEDGPENVKMNKDALDLVKSLDQRGILQSICSKNDSSLAWKKLTDEKLDHFFLYPEIHWNPKSQSIKRIANNLNISIDSIGFIDDSIRELEEVASNLPNVKLYNADEISNLLDYSEFNIPITSMSHLRREMYITELKRSSSLIETFNDPDAFLLSCQMELMIGHPKDQIDIDRCLELLQRTNQFNLTGNKYSYKGLENLLDSSKHKSFFGRLRDKFGEMGIVIFFSVNTSNKNEVIIEEFVMSCRVAQKNVDLAVIQWICQNFIQTNQTKIQIRYKNTGKNKPMLKILRKLSLLINDSNRQITTIDISHEILNKNYFEFVKISDSSKFLIYE
jgi:FkbH-like protein